MEHLFTSLSRRQSMLLLSAVTFGGSGAPAALELLPEDEAELLKARAQELLAIPREKRVPLLVQEIKRLVNARKGQLAAADPARLAEVLRHERPVLVEVLLRAFPQPLAEAVRAQLPPMKAERVREPNAQVLALVRSRLEAVLARTGAPARFKFSDVLRLQPRELFTLVDAAGARALGQAVAGLPDPERAALYAALPPDHRVQLRRAADAAREAGRRLEEQDARALLEPHGLGSANAGVARSAGVQRLARAALAQSSEFAALLVEKYPGEFGRLVARWVREERARAVNRGDGGRAELVHELDRLEQEGKVTRPVRAVAPEARATEPSDRDDSPPRRRTPERPVAAPSSAPSRPPRPSAGTRDPAKPSAPSLPAPPPPKPRDWMAERALRKVEAQRADGQRRDPIAERHARSAGVRSAREEAKAPARDDSGTHVARPPRQKR